MNTTVREGMRKALETVGYHGREVSITCHDWALWKRGTGPAEEILQGARQNFPHPLGALVTRVELPVSSLDNATRSLGGIARTITGAWLKGMRERPIFEPVLLHLKILTLGSSVGGGGGGSVVLRYPKMEWYVDCLCDSDTDRLLKAFLTEAMGVPRCNVLESRYDCWSARESLVYLDLP